MYIVEMTSVYVSSIQGEHFASLPVTCSPIINKLPSTQVPYHNSPCGNCFCCHTFWKAIAYSHPSNK